MVGNWDNPWMIGGGVKHTVETARLVAHLAAEGQEGIVGPRDLQVRALATPGGRVRISPGACAINNRNGTVSYDTYAARLPVEDRVDVAPTGSARGRCDLVVARIRNPFLANEPFQPPAPEAVDDYIYAETYVIQNIATTTAGQHPTGADVRGAIGGTSSAIPLASILLPANTASVTAAMIQDQRAIARFREQQYMRVVNPSGTVTLNGTKILGATQVQIPAWATSFDATATCFGVRRPKGNLNGKVRMVLENSEGTITTANVIFDDGNADQPDRVVLATGDGDVNIPAAMRGRSANLRMVFERDLGVTDATAPPGAAVSFHITFQTKPERI